jgi:hypothetical protein
MTERSTFDGFEQRVAGAFERYVAAATDPRPAAEIAEVAMQPRGLVVRARNASQRRRIFLVGLAAAFLMPAAFIGGGGLRSPEPDRVVTVSPSPTAVLRPTAAPVTTPATFVSVFVRRHEGPDPGISIIAVRPNGDEAVIRTLSDALLTDSGTFTEWGTVSESGWIALGVGHLSNSWPMVLVDLRDPASLPWLIEEANIGGVGPRWGPTGLLAAPGDGGIGANGVVIVDPEARTTRTVSMQGHGLIGGGPSIVWAADGSGIAGSRDGRSAVIPLDGSAPRPGVGPVFDPRGAFGPGLTRLQTCDTGENCPGSGDGRVQVTDIEGSPKETIWRQMDQDRALAAGFGRREGEYWISLDHDRGRQVSLLRVLDGREEAIGTFNRHASWQYVGAPIVAPDDSAAVVWIDLGGVAAAVLAPLDGSPSSFHAGLFAGFVDTAASVVFSTARYESGETAMPSTGAPYALPSVEQLIASELALNPGRRVLASGTRDAVEGDTEIREFEITRTEPGSGEAYLDCFGPSSVTARSGVTTTTNPCLRAGAYGFSVDASGPITVTASGDTSWRVVVYTP